MLCPLPPSLIPSVAQANNEIMTCNGLLLDRHGGSGFQGLCQGDGGLHCQLLGEHSRQVRRPGRSVQEVVIYQFGFLVSKLVYHLSVEKLNGCLKYHIMGSKLSSVGSS